MADADDTTVKIRPYAGKADVVPQDNLTEEQNNALELVKKSAQLEEEKKKSVGHLKTIEQLQASLGQEQARNAELARKIDGLEAKAREFTELEAKVKELTGVLGKISNIASAMKTG